MHTSDGPTSEENGAPHPLHDGAEPEPGSDDRNGSHPAPAASGQATAAERFAARHYDDVFHYCLRHVGSKEDAQDYRYFPEPDLVPIEISDEWIERVKSEMPELPDVKKKRYMDTYGLPEYDVDIITGSKYLVNIFEKALELNTKHCFYC